LINRLKKKKIIIIIISLTFIPFFFILITVPYLNNIKYNYLG